MSRNIARTSRDLVLSKPRRISFTRSISWFVVESPGRNRGWFLVMCRCEVMCSKVSVKIGKNGFSNILPQTGRMIINCLPPFLNTGVTLASFQISGYIAVDKMLLKIILRGENDRVIAQEKHLSRYSIGAIGLIWI